MDTDGNQIDRCCEMCGRSGVELTKHHCYPKSTQRSKWFKSHCNKEDKNKGIEICWLCHEGIHTLFTEKELCRFYNDLETLMANERILKHIEWVRKQKT
jgi:hypothetical protein